MNAALDALCGFIISNLPDSIRERKALLGAMLLILPSRHPLRSRVEGLRLHLEAHERHQLELALDFKAESVADMTGNDKKGKSK
jgi:hypothetical protein